MVNVKAIWTAKLKYTNRNASFVNCYVRFIKIGTASWQDIQNFLIYYYSYINRSNQNNFENLLILSVIEKNIELSIR